MKKQFKWLSIIIICVIVINMLVTTARAESTHYAPYRGYEYNDLKKSTAAPVGYIADKSRYGNDLSLPFSIGHIAAACYTRDNSENPRFFFLEDENSRVIKTDTEYRLLSYCDRFSDKNGNAVLLNGTKDMCVSRVNNWYYIAKENKVLIADPTGLIVSEITAETVQRNVFSPISVTEAPDGIAVLDGEAPDGYDLFSLDGAWIRREKISGTRFSDLFFDAENQNLYCLDGSRQMIWDVLGGTEILLAEEAREAQAFSMSGDRLYFYLIKPETGELIKLLSDGTVENTAFNRSKAELLIYNDQNDQLLLSVGNKNFSLDIYDSGDILKQNITDLQLELNQPRDMQLSDGSLYILDSGNGRVVKTNIEFTQTLAIYSVFFNGEALLDITGSSGICVNKNGDIIIADTENFRVLLSDTKGRVFHTIERPENLYDTDAPFRASKVLEDQNGYLYVLTDSINMGAFVFSPSAYEFERFYGSNKVEATADVIINFLRRRFLTQEQLAALGKYTPIALVSFDIDKDGFIYTVTEADQTKINADTSTLVRKLNFTGKNVFELNNAALGFGDLEWELGDILNTSFTDVDVDDFGFINLIDKARGKIFQYSQQGYLISVVGGYGEQNGLFTEPSAVESVGERIYVLDSAENSMTVFRPTEYASKLRTATKLLDDADGNIALTAWREVLELNTNSLYPYYGIGIASEILGDFEAAMKNYRIAGAREEYSKAFREYRKVYVRDNLWLILLIAAAAILISIAAIRMIKHRMTAKHGVYSAMETKWGLPVYCLAHPIEGFEQFRHRNLQSSGISAGIVLCWFFLKILQFFCTGFAFNENRAVDYDLLSTVFSTVFLFILFVTANWSMATFLDGKGRLKEIISVAAYALTPMLISMLVNILISNFLTLEESAIMGIIGIIGYCWSGAVLLMGLYTIHRYSFTKTAVSIVLSALSMVIIVLLAALFLALTQQALSFISSLVYEWKLR